MATRAKHTGALAQLDVRLERTIRVQRVGRLVGDHAQGERAAEAVTQTTASGKVLDGLAAQLKAKIVNLSRPGNLHGVSISIQVPRF